MPTFSQTIHRHAPLPAHGGIHLVHPFPKRSMAVQSTVSPTLPKPGVESKNPLSRLARRIARLALGPLPTWKAGCLTSLDGRRTHSLVAPWTAGYHAAANGGEPRMVYGRGGSCSGRSLQGIPSRDVRLIATGRLSGNHRETITQRVNPFGQTASQNGNALPFGAN